MDVSHDILVRLLMGGKTLFEAGINLVVGGTYKMYQVVRRHFACANETVGGRQDLARGRHQPGGGRHVQNVPSCTSAF